MRKLFCIAACVLLVMLLPVAAFATGEGTGTCTHTVSSWTAAAEGHTGTCSDCGAQVSGSHSYTGWTTTADSHLRRCSLCGKEESGAHSWNQGTATTHATCVAEGVTTYTCTVCSGTKTQSIAATGVHSFENGRKIDDTNHTLTCAYCLATTTGEHIWERETVTTAATCYSVGKKTIGCTKCDATKEADIAKTAHTFSAWQEIDGKHSRTCTVEACGHTEAGAHTWDQGTVIKDSDCKTVGEKKFTCSTCGKTRLEQIALKTEHTYDNACDAECNICGLTRDADHKYNKTLSRNSTRHWYACSVCGDKKDEKSHVPGPAATEQKAQTCLTCGYEMMPKKNHTHDYSKTKWSSDPTGHWHACTGCEVELEFDDHTYDDPCSTKCTVCGYINDKGHIYDGTWESDKNSHWAICRVCDTASKPETHVPGPEATDTEPQKCTVCGYELVSAQEHTHGLDLAWQTNEADHWKECECGEKLELASHDWDEGTKNKDKTVTYTCRDCGETKTEEPVKESSGFPWWIFLVLMILCLAGAVVALILLIRMPNQQQGKFSQKR